MDLIALARGRVIGMLIVLSGLPCAGPLAGQGVLIDARLEAALERDPAQAEVRIRYRLRPDSAGTHVPVAALPVAGVRLVELRVTVTGGNPMPLVLTADPEQPAPARLIGAIPLPENADTVEVEIYYRVISPGGIPSRPRRVELPVVAVLWPPAEAIPGTFSGTVSVHPGLTLRDAFPSGLARSASVSDRPGGGRIHAFDLPVTPALVAFTLTAIDAGPGLERVLDIAALLAVLLFGFIGWRRFRAEM